MFVTVLLGEATRRLLVKHRSDALRCQAYCSLILSLRVFEIETLEGLEPEVYGYFYPLERPVLEGLASKLTVGVPCGIEDIPCYADVMKVGFLRAELISVLEVKCTNNQMSRSEARCLAEGLNRAPLEDDEEDELVGLPIRSGFEHYFVPWM